MAKKFDTGDYVHDFYNSAKFGENPSMGGFWANTWNISQNVFYLYPFFKETPTGQTAGQIYALNGSNDANSRKDVPSLALVDSAVHLWDKIAPKPQFLGRE